jgi:hypothetical protein
LGQEVYNEFVLQAQPLGLQLSKKEIERIIGYYAEGYLGQYLVIYPRHNLVAVRMKSENHPQDDITGNFADFKEQILKLVL